MARSNSVMKKNFEIEFADRKGEKGRTKFGGQPDWLTKQEWPISEETGEPMRFICQIDLPEIGLENLEAKFAYLFMTDGEEYVDGTWEPDGGENAIILQPGHNAMKTREVSDGPTLYTMVEQPDRPKLVPQPFECAVNLTPSIDKEALEDELEIINKFGGAPVFLQYDEYPYDDKTWELLIQLDSANVPFNINFGDAGVGYGFISPDGTKAKFLWQCM